MTNSDDAMIRIAQALEKISQTPFLHTTAGQLVILVFGAILGALITYLVKWWEESRDQERKRRLLVSLIGDEIVLRWNRLIGKGLKDPLKAFNLENVAVLCRTRFQPGDLYVFEQCANDISLATVFKDNAAVSQIIYVYILARDFRDTHAALCKRYDEYQKLKNGQKTKRLTADAQVVKEKIRIIWGNLKTIYEDMDSQMLRIFERLEKEYDDFITSSATIRQQTIGEAAVRKKLESVGQKRIPGEKIEKSKDGRE